MSDEDCIIAVALGIALSAAGASGALAQAGSTGGTLGNTDKSISGDREGTAPTGAATTASCYTSSQGIAERARN